MNLQEKPFVFLPMRNGSMPLVAVINQKDIFMPVVMIFSKWHGSVALKVRKK